MPDRKLPWDGGCRCGRVRIRVTKPPMLTMACHCLGCQTMSASAFSLSMALPIDGLEVTQGETVIVIGGIRGVPAHHHFCDWCRTWMFTRVEQFGLVNLRPTMLDEHQDFTPFIETQTAEKLPWATTPAKHAFERFPAMEDYQALIAEYQTSQA